MQKSVGRGKVDVFLTIDSAAADKVSVTLNKPVADGYYTALTQMRDAYGLRDDISVSLLSRFPDVFLVEKEQGDAEEIVADISQVLAQALEEFNAMRTREGEKLAQDIRGKAEKIAQLVAQVEARSPESVNEYREKLRQRMRRPSVCTAIWTNSVRCWPRTVLWDGSWTSLSRSLTGRPTPSARSAAMWPSPVWSWT